MVYTTPNAPTPFRFDNVARCDSCGSAFAFRTAKAKACYAKKKAAYVNAAFKAKLALKAVEQAYDALKADAQWHWQDDACAWIKQGKTKSKNKFASRFALSLISRHTQAKLTAMNLHVKFDRRTGSVLPAPQLVPVACRRPGTADWRPPSYPTPPVVPMAHPVPQHPPVGEGMAAGFGRSATAERNFSSEAKESFLAVGTVFTGLECEVPKAPAGTQWFPLGSGPGKYIYPNPEVPHPWILKAYNVERILKAYNVEQWRQEIPPPEEIPLPQDFSLLTLLKIQKESTIRIAQWCIDNIEPDRLVT